MIADNGTQYQNVILFEFGQAVVNGKQLRVIRNFNEDTKGDVDRDRGAGSTD